jgi:hypothetical protein
MPGALHRPAPGAVNAAVGFLCCPCCNVREMVAVNAEVKLDHPWSSSPK